MTSGTGIPIGIRETQADDMDHNLENPVKSEEQCLSKKAKKRAEKLAKLKAERKEKRKLRKERLKERKQTENRDEKRNEHSKWFLRQEMKKKMMNSLEVGQRIAIDMRYDQLMNEKELIHLASQIRRSYGVNRGAEKPVKLMLVNMNEEGKSFKVCSEKNDGFANYLVERSSKSILDLVQPEEIVYLSPDAQQTLDEIKPEKVYVIGGLSDDSVKKRSSLDFANQHNLQCVRLPISEHCTKAEDGTYSQILTINGVLEILIHFMETGSWPQAFGKALPKRFGWKPKT